MDFNAGRTFLLPPVCQYLESQWVCRSHADLFFFFCVCGLSDLWVAMFSVFVLAVGRPFVRLKIFSAAVKPNKYVSWTLREQREDLQSVLPTSPWTWLGCRFSCVSFVTSNFSWFGDMFPSRMTTYYVLSDTCWQIQFDFTLQVFLDWILSLWKVIKRVVLFKGQIVSHLLMGPVLGSLKTSIHLHGTTHGVNGICCKQRLRSLSYLSQGDYLGRSEVLVHAIDFTAPLVTRWLSGPL